jgi:hypothetical protein
MVCIFSMFINMAEGTAYGVVPFMQPKNLGVVSGLVGAGGTAGGVICTAAFYKPGTHPLLSLKLHALYIFVTALTVPLLSWPQFGSMFSRPADEEKSERECCSPAKQPQQLSPDNSPRGERKDVDEAVLAAEKEKASEMAKKMAHTPKGSQSADAELQNKLKSANDEIAQLKMELLQDKVKVANGENLLLKKELEDLRAQKKAALDLGDWMAGNVESLEDIADEKMGL